PHHREALVVADPLGSIDRAAMQVLRRFAATDAFDRVAAIRADLSGLHPVCEPRADRVGEDNANTGDGSLETSPNSADRPSCTSARNECSDATVRLCEYLDTRRLRMNTDVGRIIELIGEEPPVLDSHPLRYVAEVVAARRWGIGRDHDLRSQRGQRLALVNRHLLRHHADEA